MKTERLKGQVAENKKYGHSYRERKRRKNSFKLPAINKNTNGDSDVGCDGDDEGIDSEDDLLQTTMKDRNYLTRELPKGVICKECAKIGMYTRSADVKRVIQNSGKDKNMKEKCSICNTLNSSQEGRHENILLTILYSHTFYDKFSREKKESTDTEGMLTKEEKKIPQGCTNCKPPSTTGSRGVPNYKHKPKTNQTQSSSLHQSKSEERDNVKEPSLTSKSFHIPPLPLDDRSKEFPDSGSENESNQVIDKQSVAVHTLFPDDKGDGGSVLNETKSLAKRKQSESFSTLYRKRAMKGSTIKRDNRSKDEVRQKRYTVESLGLTFGIPEFNFRLAGRTIQKPIPETARSECDSSSRPSSLLPPIKQIHTPISMRST